MTKKGGQAQDWIEVLRNYFENECYWCKATVKLDLHHILPLSRGGKNEIANIQLICRKCHLKIHFQFKKYFPLEKKVKLIKCQYCEIKSKKMVCIKCKKRRERKGLLDDYPD